VTAILSCPWTEQMYSNCPYYDVTSMGIISTLQINTSSPFVEAVH